VTREAARSGFERFVEDALSYTVSEFSVARAFRSGSSGAGGAVVDRLLKDSEAVRERVVRPELDAYRERILAQFDVLLDCVESGDDIGAYREPILATDAYHECLREDLAADRRSSVCDRLVERQHGLAEAVRPLVDSPAGEFWTAAGTAFDRGEMARLIEDHFAFTDPMEDHRGAFRMATTVDPGDVLGGGFLASRLPTIEVEYTEEALRSMRRAERRVIRETKADLDCRF
jgi:hypothetical protein